MLDRFQLDGRVALLIGAGRGIGAAAALALAEAGADIVVLARHQDQVERVASEARSFGGAAIAIAGDGHDPETAAAVVERTIDELGRLDVLVNALGGWMPRPFLDTSDSALRTAFDQNTVSVVRFVRAAVPHLLRSDAASVVLVSSALGHLVERGYLGYGVGKAALEHATRLMAADLAPRIRVNAVAPGAILTDALSFVAADDAMRGAIEERTPLRRLGQPDDIAAAVLYLASPASAYVTGQILAVDGGLLRPNFDLGLPDL